MSLWLLVLTLGLSSPIFVDYHRLSGLFDQMYRVNQQQEYTIPEIAIAFHNPQSMNSTYSQGCMAKLQQQEYITALADCKQTIKEDADNLEAHLNLGLVYYHLENYQDAIAQYQFVIQHNPHDYRAFYNWGLVRDPAVKRRGFLTVSQQC